MTEYELAILMLLVTGTLALVWGTTVLWRATGT